jgi:hypothetical protein
MLVMTTTGKQGRSRGIVYADLTLTNMLLGKSVNVRALVDTSDECLMGAIPLESMDLIVEPHPAARHTESKAPGRSGVSGSGGCAAFR